MVEHSRALMAKFSSVIQEDARLVVAQMGPALQPLAGKTILVTGAAGFLCSYLVDVLVAASETLPEPCRIIALDNFQSSVPDRVAHLAGHPNVQSIAHDIRQPFVPDGPVDYILHGASIASPMFYRKFPLETIDANVTGTRLMLDLARATSARSIIVMSTSEIYGNPDPARIPTDETYNGDVSCTGPRACYDESKRLAETLCQAYFQLYRTPVKVIRPFNVYGPGQRLDDARIIPDLMTAAVHRTPLVLFSDGRATRSFCYVRDAIAGILYVLLSDADGEPFNVGNDEEISIRDLAARMIDVAGPPDLSIEFRVSEDAQYTVDNPQRRRPVLTKLKSLAPWTPSVPLTEGLARTLRSYRELHSGGDA
jgi:UDP-glucuronate decarboxylase